ncbi:hypothetical protein EVAR_62352_1 [Eumeta japonica]|uniref:Uncharacterized protein n=1 Tax=Eumeta variegata TaxID=151549 RepID=A0A4C1ZLV2_EUMVA|nr:hypothetical protein EVAR_62352_1 [Eumeta japonica]
MDPLVEVPIERYPELRDSFKRHWPRAVPGYYAIQSQLVYPQFREACQFAAYCPYGDIDNGMVAISIKGVFYEVVVQPNSKSVKKIEEAIATTRRIDWSREVCFSFADTEVLQMIRRLKSRLRFDIVMECPAFKHFLSKNSGIIL